jgi:surface antigen
MNFKLAAAMMSGLAAIAGCASGPDHPAVVAPAGGGHAAPQPAPSLLGAGAAFSDADQAFMAQKINQALEGAPSGLAVDWQNPDDGASVQFTPGRPYQLADNTYCRSFTETITTGREPSTTRGAACRQSDGTWRAAG